MTAEETERTLRAYERERAMDQLDRVGRLMAELAAFPEVINAAAGGPRGAAVRKVQGMLREAAEKAFRLLANARHEALVIVSRHGVEDQSTPDTTSQSHL